MLGEKITDHSKIYNEDKVAEDRGYNKALQDVKKVLISDGDYGHETFSLTYLRGLLKELKRGAENDRE